MYYSTFLRWWLFAVVIIVGCMFAQYLGVFDKIYDNDSTGLSMLIGSLFVITSGWAGYISYKLARESKEILSEPEKVNFQKNADVGWFISDLCLNIGMIGTIIGFIFVLTGFATTDISNVVAMQDLLLTMGQGMSMALYTTLVGLVCGSILKIQFFNIDHALKEEQEGLLISSESIETIKPFDYSQIYMSPEAYEDIKNWPKKEDEIEIINPEVQIEDIIWKDGGWAESKHGRKNEQE
jgi:hypothetical protein